MRPAERELELRDGARVAVRPIRAGDREAIREAFGRLSPETRYRRFLSSAERLSDSDLRYLTEVDVNVTASNCVQCGAITAKGGRLTLPEGGDGPLYQET